MIVEVATPIIAIALSGLIGIASYLLKRVIDKIDHMANDMTSIKIETANRLKASTVREIIDDKIMPIQVKVAALNEKLDLVLVLRSKQGRTPNV